MSPSEADQSDARLARLAREAAALAPERRRAFLDESCAGDTLLRSRVEALLSSQDQATLAPGVELFESAPTETRARAGASIGPRGRRLGAYTLLEVLGEGGMGVVYLAEQDRPRRTIALKVVRPGLLTARMLRRFELEGQVLGRLSHPGIAAIHEAGAADAGDGPQPYFAMELVRGPTLTDYARAKALPVRSRLELLIRVCDAVHHAHQKGVVHRDLKPGNILVTAEGQPKVLDFGVARAVDGESAGASLATGAGAVVGTLPYMSPEQAAGRERDVDTRSDVYALGVILYELLAGRLPLDVAGKPLPEAARIIGLHEPVRLGLVAPACRGDLETIVGKALEKDVRRRYQSASELAGDLGRYLRHEPIGARPPSAGYLMSRFARRHRALVAGGSAAVLLLMLGVVGTTWQAARAEKARDAAEKAGAAARDEAEIATQTSDLLRSMLGALNPEEAMGREPTVRELIDRAAADLDARPDLSPRVEMATRETLGRTYHTLSRLEEAQRQYARVRNLASVTFGPEDRQALAARRNLAGVLADRGKYDEAEREVRGVLEVLTRTAGADDPEAAMAEMELGRILQETGRMKEAVPILRRAATITREKLGPSHRDSITALSNLGTALKDLGELDESIDLLREALSLREKAHGHDHPETLYTRNNLAAALQRSTRPGAQEEAERLLRETLEARARVLGPDHASTTTTRSNLAVVLIEQKKFEQALPMALGVHESWSRTLGPEHPKTLIALANLAYLYEDLGRLDEAEAAYRRVLEVRRRISGGKDPETWASMNNLAMLLGRRGDHAAAEPLYRELLGLCEGALPPGHPYPAIFRNNFGACLMALGKHEEAEPALRTTLDTIRAKFGPDHPRTRTAIERLAALLAATGRADEAGSLRAPVSAR